MLRIEETQTTKTARGAKDSVRVRGVEGHVKKFAKPCLDVSRQGGGPIIRRRTNVQQLTCKIDLSNSFYYLFFSFVLIELKPFVLKGKVPGEKL